MCLQNYGGHWEGYVAKADGMSAWQCQSQCIPCGQSPGKRGSIHCFVKQNNFSTNACVKANARCDQVVGALVRLFKESWTHLCDTRGLNACT
eukprot:9897-Amphidinium_carterae.1